MNWDFFLLHASYLLLFIALFFLAKWLKGLFSSYNLDEQLTQHDNVAVSVSLAGYFAGVTIVFLGAIIDSASAASSEVQGSFFDQWPELLEITAYALGGILLLHASRFINKKAILYKFSVDKEIIKDHNPGTGVVEGATYIASALIIAGSISGEGSVWTAFAFYAIGQVCLVLFAQVYSMMSPYSLHDEIEKDNLAAGLGFAGGIISIGIIIMRAVAGDFKGWAEDLMTLGLDVLVVFVYLIAVRFVFDKFILKNSDLATEISNDQNVGAGLLEMIVAICFSAILFFVL